MLEVINAGLNLSHKTLLQDVSLNVAPGELLAVCGPNGAGKSSLMRLISGELKPSTGDVRWHGHSLAEWPLLKLARQRA
nr:ATP-binding cassette domain-containing protein [Methylobacillus glycogenes]